MNVRRIHQKQKETDMTNRQRVGVIVIIAAILIKVINTCPEGGWSFYARLAVVLAAAAGAAWILLKEKIRRKQ